MDTIKLHTLGIAIALTAAAATSMAASPNTFGNGRSYFGSLGGETAYARVVDVAAVKQLNVRYRETITFRSDGTQFTWTFNGLDDRVVGLSEIAPTGFAAKPFTIYIAQDPSSRN